MLSFINSLKLWSSLSGCSLCDCTQIEQMIWPPNYYHKYQEQWYAGQMGDIDSLLAGQGWQSRVLLGKKTNHVLSLLRVFSLAVGLSVCDRVAMTC